MNSMNQFQIPARTVSIQFELILLGKAWIYFTLIYKKIGKVEGSYLL